MVLGVRVLPHLSNNTPVQLNHTNKLTQAVPQGQRLTHNNNKQAEKQAG
jgi:hypothetical protein